MRMSHSGRVVAVLSVATMALAACSGTVGGGSGGGDESSSQTLKIGFVSPQTGPLAAFGEADSFVIKQMQAYFGSHPIVAGGKKYKVQILLKDAQSTSTRAGQVAGELINSDDVDLLMASSTPDIDNPVSEQCEANSVPCITSVAPWQPFAIRSQDGKPADLKYSHHFFWGLEDVAKVYGDMWSQLPTNKKVGGLFPNDPDGQAWSANLPGLLKPSGVTFTTSGLFPDGTQDFSAQISKYKGTEILSGVPIPPDFATFWRQAQQQGYKPKIATVAKALLFPSSVEALGKSGANISTEVWWHPTAPYTSALTGETAKELADAYEAGTGKEWTQPLGFSYAMFEVAAAAVAKAGSIDPTAVNKAMTGLSVSTIVGKITWGQAGLPPYIAKTPLGGGQWRATKGKYPYELVVVSNAAAPLLPKGGSLEPLP